MNQIHVRVLGLVVLGAVLASMPARGQWLKDDKTIGWKLAEGDNEPIWKFSFDSSKGKPFFHPISAGAGTDMATLTNFKPQDHPWHYALWFSWKYINHDNYWEEDRSSGQAVGKTAWKTPTIETKPDGSATIKLEVTYTSSKGQVDLTESREIVVSAATKEGAYTIDWKGHFKAGEKGAELDRTPMPGEPGGATNGGYAGLGVRMISQPAVMSVITTTAAVTQWPGSRARPNSPAVACNFTNAGKDIGGIAILADSKNPANVGDSSTWYLIKQNDFSFACPSVLAPKIITLKADETMDLHYQIAVSPKNWTIETLKAAYEEWKKK